MDQSHQLQQTRQPNRPYRLHKTLPMDRSNRLLSIHLMDLSQQIQLTRPMDPPHLTRLMDPSHLTHLMDLPQPMEYPCPTFHS